MNDADRDLKQRVREIAPGAPFPRERIHRRIGKSLDAPRRRGGGLPSWLRAAAAVAAGVLLFVAGVEYGRRNVGSAVAVDGSVPTAIQSSGSEWVASISRLRESEAGLDPEQVEQARQVALAVMYGAALELVRNSPDDEMAAAVYRALSIERRNQAAEGEQTRVWF